jgi:hypothetical protein
MVLWRVFDAYGPQRCYWATDMTNCYQGQLPLAATISPKSCSCLRATRTEMERDPSRLKWA